MAVAILFSLYCLEAGIFFVLAPWTRFWAMSPLLHSTHFVAAIVDNAYFRGFVSGFGVVHLIVGARELILLLRSRHGDGSPSA